MQTAIDMRRVIIAGLLAACAMPAIAEWTLVAEVERGAVYIDLNTIRKDGTLRQFWTVVDFSKPMGKEGYRSSRSRDEMDCKKEQTRIISHSVHTKAMASGKVMGTYPGDNQWQEIPPGTPNQVIFKIVCTTP